MDRRTKLLSVLAGGGFHSGETLATALGVSRTAIWKHIQSLSNWGLDVYAVRGRGYSLAQPLRLLDRGAILAGIPAPARALITQLELFPVVESTNGYLLDIARRDSGRGRVCLAERQTHGRGRRGRMWVSPFARNLYVSVLWRFQQPPSAIGGLGLAIGIAVADALRAGGAINVGLKWPNDIYWQDRKLGGILLEMFGEAGGPSTVVVGMGVNVDMGSSSTVPTIDQPWTDFATAASNPAPCRNTLAALLLREVFSVLETFETCGLSPFVGRWNALDVLKGREVDVRLPTSTVRGVANGIDDDGALLLYTGGQSKRFVSGELSLRLAFP